MLNLNVLLLYIFDVCGQIVSAMNFKNSLEI